MTTTTKGVLAFLLFALSACAFLKPAVKPTLPDYAVAQAQCGQDNPGQEVRCAMVLRSMRYADYRAARQVILVDPFGTWPELTEAKTSWLKSVLRQEHQRLLGHGDAEGARQLREATNAQWLFHDEPVADGS